MALVRSRNDVIWNELAAISLSQPPGHGLSLTIRHEINARPPRLNFARVFGKLFLILLRPGCGVFQYVFQGLRRHPTFVPQSLTQGTAFGVG